jgi:hypothetical protein
VLQERPFRPFRLVLTGGVVHEIRHPEMAIVTPSTVFIGIPAPDAPAPAAGDVVIVSLLHVVQIEYLPSPATPAVN